MDRSMEADMNDGVIFLALHVDVLGSCLKES